MSSPDTFAHVRAESLFVDDLPEPAGTLHAAVFGSPVAHGAIRAMDVESAAMAPGVIAIFTARDIPGENQLGVIIEDEPLLAEDEVHYVGQPIAVVVAESSAQAREAVKRIAIDIDKRPPEFDPRRAAARGDLIAPARTLSLGNVDEAWARCATIVAGRVDSGGQEHLYLETQAALAIPEARGRMRLYTGTQSPSVVQRVAARILACPMHNIEVEVQRLGGAFGGKEEQATPWAAMAALAAQNLQRPVKLVLLRHEDMRMTGKRHPYSTDYRLGLDGNGRFLAFEATYYQNSGAAADLSPAILERSLFHATNSYFIPNVQITGMCCRTNLPPFTAFRGFGAPQAMFVMESAIAAAAEILNIPALQLQQANLLRPGNELPFGMRIEGDASRRSFETALARFDVKARREEIARHNETSPYLKRGLAIMPICFGISFTNTTLNQAGALVHIYFDGSVSVSTGAVEMGQGVLTKLRRIVAFALGIAETRVRLESTNTTRVANISPTSASTGTDLNGAAAVIACRLIMERLKTVAAALHDTTPERIAIREERVWIGDTCGPLDWHTLVQTAYSQRVDLSAHAFYATPDIHYDKKNEKGHPFAYHVCGTAVVEARLDALRGTAAIESVQIIHDAGRSLDLLVDRGQVEGAVVQGIGWLTIEELVHSPEGRLLSDSLSSYKIPDFHFAPPRIEVDFLEDPSAPGAVMQSKAIGEPPFMYGIGAFFAIRAAMRSVRDIPCDLIRAPLTNEQILRQLEGLPPAE
ncbi:MAG: molybdopterin-dependent oxidoreductase [Proteobacteria bacterium]|nr:molybdopterin-dependent oxidoreductase [Pseudomonadota bacterium]